MKTEEDEQMMAYEIPEIAMKDIQVDLVMEEIRETSREQRLSSNREEHEEMCEQQKEKEEEEGLQEKQEVIEKEGDKEK